jgi:hypothetical protein
VQIIWRTFASGVKSSKQIEHLKISNFIRFTCFVRTADYNFCKAWLGRIYRYPPLKAFQLANRVRNLVFVILLLVVLVYTVPFVFLPLIFGI